jgi:tetratricopeptide (TPR) repeat protein
MQFHPSDTLITNRYEIAGRPLVGGMGIVYLCFDHQEQRPVALKTFKPEFLPDRAARERFLEEGDTWVRLGKHPHIVQAYGVERIGDGREVYIVLELVAKEERRRDASLRAWLTPGKPLPVDQALLIALQIVRGMRHATDTIPGFVHRDLKPENVLMGADHLSNATINRVRVTDFGLVKGLRAEQVIQAQGLVDSTSRPGQLTRADALLGTPHYMAPEQWESAKVDVQADIYAFGCILGEMLIGQPLVKGRTLNELRQAHNDGYALASMERVAPETVRDLLVGCLAAQQVRRFGDWATAENALIAAYVKVTGQPVPEGEGAGILSRTERVAAGWSASMIGASYVDIGSAQTALVYFERSRNIGQVEGEHRLEATGLANLGVAHTDLGNAREATACLQQSLAIHRKIGDRRGEGYDLGNLGNAYADLGDSRLAISLFKQALTIRREFGDRQAEGLDLGNLGNAYLDLGDPERAIGYYERALAIRREIGDRRGEGGDLSGIGNAYVDLGDTQRAIDYYDRALAIRREMGDRRGEGTDLGNLGNAYLRQDDTRRAIGFYEQALVIRREIGDRRGEGQDLGNLGEAYRQLGNAQMAISLFGQALLIHREIGNRSGIGAALGNLGIAYAGIGDSRHAFACFEQGLAIHREIDDRNGVAMSSLNLAIFHSQQGDLALALPLARDAVRLFAQIGHLGQTQRAEQLVAQLERGEGPGPKPAETLEAFGFLIDAAVAVAQGAHSAPSQIDAFFEGLSMLGWMVVSPIRRIWAGERNETTLTAGLDASDALIVREILHRLLGK